MVPLTDIEQRRGRLLLSVFVVLAAFSALSVAFSLLGPSILEPLQVTPTAARVGVLVLTIGFIALVWEKERHFGALSQTVARQEVLLAAFENRIKVVEELLDATDRLSSPLAIDDVMGVILDAAVELVGAEVGTIELAESESDIALARTKSTGAPPRLDASRLLVRFPLATARREMGVLTLTLPAGASGLDNDTFEVVERFAVLAAMALEKAHLLARERASVAHLEAANAVKARFLTTVSHELRTPLTSIIGFSTTLREHWDQLDETTRKEFVEQVEMHGTKLGGIVERLLEAARVELQGLLVCPVLHDARAAARDAIAPFLERPDADRLEFALPASDVQSEVDPFVIDQLLTNLVDNALRYTHGKVRVAMDAFENNLVFRVSDVGDGIDPETLRVVTDPFYRFEEAADTECVGLHIVRMLVESHGGRGQIDSDERGTTAVFVIPRFPSVGSSNRVLDAINA
ncbi:MAG: hypothetical protein KY391_04810 [Actinobacteria bacterium]|nr:hypothetical protein [Actinomycetota bacterium]